MARLNEAPAAAPESVEALKRRFIRQNREIARINSNQSIRIRNLENEISRLLSENIALREAAINANLESERWRSSARLSKEVLVVKEKLEIKLAEMTALMGELGALPGKVARRSSQIRKGLDAREIKSPRAERPQKQIDESQEGRLPAILENKYYPRKTLDPEEIRVAVVDECEDLESPEIGPPPVAHFEDIGSVGFSTSRSPRRTSTELTRESERKSLERVENRRKRRTSSLVQPLEMEKQEEKAEPETTDTARPVSPANQEMPQMSQRIGAKRKLSMSEGDAPSNNNIHKELDSFLQQRRTNSIISSTRPSRFTRVPSKVAQTPVTLTEPNSPVKQDSPTRKILAPKSTNSPTKGKIDPEHKSYPLKDHAPSSEFQRRTLARVRTKQATVAPPSTNNIEFVDVATNNLPPKTPAPDSTDIFSPVSTEPSTKQKLPQELAPTTSVEDILNGSIGRGSRRARPAVSYAEPNLRDKMRRPGKALVGAVEGLVKPGADAEKIDVQGHIQVESVDQNARTTSEAPSPLRDKKASVLNLEPRPDQNTRDPEKVSSRLSLFDHPDSSPPNEQEDSISKKALYTRHLNSTPNTADIRRSSTNPSRRNISGLSVVESDLEVEEMTVKLPGRASALTRRRSMMV